MTAWTEAVSPISGVPSPWAFVSVWVLDYLPDFPAPSATTCCHVLTEMRWLSRSSYVPFCISPSLAPSLLLPAANQWPRAPCAAYISIRRRSSASSHSSPATNKRLHLALLVLSLRLAPSRGLSCTPPCFLVLRLRVSALLSGANRRDECFNVGSRRDGEDRQINHRWASVSAVNIIPAFSPRWCYELLTPVLFIKYWSTYN